MNERLDLIAALQRILDGDAVGDAVGQSARNEDLAFARAALARAGVPVVGVKQHLSGVPGMKTGIITVERALNAPNCYVVCLVEVRQINATRSLFWDLLDEERTRLIQAEQDIIDLAIQFGAHDDAQTTSAECRRFLDANAGRIFLEDIGYFG